VRKKLVLGFLISMIFISLFGSNVFAINNENAFSKEVMVEKHNEIIQGKQYNFTKQIHLRDSENSFVKLEFNDLNTLNKSKMNKLSYYSGLFTDKNLNELCIYYNQALRAFNSQYGKASYVNMNNSIKIENQIINPILIWGPTHNNRIILVQLNKLDHYYWLQYDILYK